MLSVDQVKKIAEYMGNKEGTYNYKYFDPIDDNSDCMDVLDALVDECKKRGWIITFNIEGFSVWYEDVCGIEVYGGKEFNNENICLAYLAVMDAKGEL